jgi:hypothetical protein
MGMKIYAGANFGSPTLWPVTGFREAAKLLPETVSPLFQDYRFWGSGAMWVIKKKTIVPTRARGNESNISW